MYNGGAHVVQIDLEHIDNEQPPITIIKGDHSIILSVERPFLTTAAFLAEPLHPPPQPPPPSELLATVMLGPKP